MLIIINDLDMSDCYLAMLKFPESGDHLKKKRRKFRALMAKPQKFSIESKIT